MRIFHFIASEITVAHLLVLCGKRKFSIFLGEVLERMLPMLDKMHFKRVVGRSRCCRIDDDPEIKRVEVRAKVPDWLYQKLKLMHQDLNIFSMAQIVREVLLMYLRFAGSKRERLEEFLGELDKRWGAVKEAYRRSGAPIRKPSQAYCAKKKRHMGAFLKGAGFSQTIYTADHSPYLIYLI